MSVALPRQDIERFRTAIIARMGLHFGDDRLTFLDNLLQRRLHKLGQSSDLYLQSLERRSADNEFTVLARELTVGETYFFRNIEQFRVLSEVALPARMNIRRPNATLRLLSAGCASGEEAYSMAIVAKETIADPCWDLDIRGVDVNPSVIQKARDAHYSPWALRETPADMQSKWFRQEGRDLALIPPIRKAVAFEEANLASDDLGLWRPGYYDVIFCRNVLMYFSTEKMRAVIARIADALAPGGFLFLGHAETLRNVSDRFHLHHSHGTFYYTVKDGEAAFARPPVQIVPKPPTSAGPLPVALDAAWYRCIVQATERVATLVPSKADGEASSAQKLLAWNIAPAFDLMRQERFADALNHVRTRPSIAGKDPDVLLLEATLLAHSGQLAAAEDACLRLLLVDEFNSGAHYVLALCRDDAGQVERAIEHDRVASYLDANFAMPRLHLGLLTGRSGNRARARHELGHALELLKREDTSRLLMFGGGFNREALMALCRAALKENGDDA